MLHSFYFFCLIALSLSILAFLYRVIRGPHAFDRLIGLNGIAAKAILFLVLIGAYGNSLNMFIDLALGYALINLVGSLAVGKYFERRGLDR